VVAIIVVAAALGGALAWFLGRDQSNAVPDLVGLQKGAALNMVSGFDWNVTTVDEPSDDMPAGSVLRTEPAVGATLNERDDFLIVVSSGSPPRTLPELVGLTIEQANAALTQLDLVLERGDTISDPTVPAESIISWSVPDQTGLTAGDTVVRGTTVRVVVSSGPAPVAVPELAGLALPEATARIEASGFVVSQLPDEFSDTVPIGSVIRQDPAVGTELPIGSPVNLVVSKGTQFVVIPPLANLTLQQANDALIAAGLVLGRVNGDPAGVNILAEVGGVSVVANATFERGTPIDLTFGTPPTTTTAPPETTTTTPPETALGSTTVPA
jgi:serine/threonine-protein kinase